ncbi:tetratricopeptide repeat protein [Treponema saccharophilum]|uniref:Uncharacterized protein n=1 Tax=Treponema saccharophilum DSM 2985 TaxID=907348 RepID=H7EJT6_9SPIR|nr:tetratricopeptide repeat protein [Treponema saccharophilum]EIC02206.1 hypothetical protein TresaDRAFT_2186 [Treponema saccharophilum DSM 2985]BDC96670.1 hypothetical protein TRSA_17690 [Treponema saccharophilum]
MKKSTTFFAIAAVVLAFSLPSCESNAPVPDDLTSKQLIQGGQSAFEKGRYKVALRYYNAALERFGDSDTAVFVEAKYEIGHIYQQQKKYEFASNVFSELLELYSVTIPGQLPGEYRKLSELGLEQIKKAQK